MREAAPPLFKLEASPEDMVTKRASVVHFLLKKFFFDSLSIQLIVYPAVTD